MNIACFDLCEHTIGNRIENSIYFLINNIGSFNMEGRNCKKRTLSKLLGVRVTA